jgi:phosphate transport system permease protein
MGEPYVWLCGAALSVSLLITLLLLLVVMWNGLGFFWPADVAEAELREGGFVIGERTAEDIDPVTGEARYQFKIGNRDWYGFDFEWVDSGDIAEISYPEDLVVLERMEEGNFYGRLKSVDTRDLSLPVDGSAWDRLQAVREKVAEAREEVSSLEDRVSGFTSRLYRLGLRREKIEYYGGKDVEERLGRLAEEEAEITAKYETILEEAREKEAKLREFTATFADAKGRTGEIVIDDIVRAYRPNAMSKGDKVGFYASKVAELLIEPPRESNTEGGIFPAIFGTVLMVFLMSLFCVPLGVVAAIYLHEYARKGILVRTVRIAVNNLAGVPSIVYGVFGLGFFVYFVGGTIDSLFYPWSNEPVFGTGGILWASLTLALLTVPVVIVSTEEGLAAIPGGIREGSLALGATKFQTLTRVVLPMASPGIMTGFVLSMARAAGEVAPLMLIGVVKSVQKLPLDGQFPYFHPSRKFMHLGFHIYDLGFQSPNVEAVRPMVYVTTMLLLGVVVLMSAAAIFLRNRMRRKYMTGAF